MTSPAWTPDGEYLVVSKARPPDPGTFWLFMYHRDGGTGVRIGSPPPPQPSPDAAPGPPPPPPPNRMGAVVSPDGRFIYYAQRTGCFTYNARFPLWQIHRHDRETGDMVQVTNAQGSAMRPVLSPDGTHLVYATRYKAATALRIRNLETGAERWLAYPGDARRPGVTCLARHDAALRLHARRPVAARADRRQARARRRRDRAPVRPCPSPRRSQAEIAPRVYTPVRVDDGGRCARVSSAGRRSRQTAGASSSARSIAST